MRTRKAGPTIHALPKPCQVKQYQRRAGKDLEISLVDTLAGLEEPTEPSNKPGEGDYSNCTHAEHELDSLAFNVGKGTAAGSTRPIYPMQSLATSRDSEWERMDIPLRGV